MTKRIFKNTMLVIMLVILLCGVVIFGIIYGYFDNRLSEEISSETNYIARGVELGGYEYLESMDDSEARITWVAEDGTVLYDNRADISKMDNHANRTEIKEAKTSLAGNSVRYSNTLSQKTSYHAIKLDDETVIRVAYTQNSVLILVLGMMQPMIVVFIVALIIAGVLTYRVSGQIIAPLDKIDLDNPEETEVYEEMVPFVRKIMLQNHEINDAMNKLREKQYEFNVITENMQEGFIVVDKKALVLSHNTSALRMFGLSQSVENKSILILNRTEEFGEIVNSALDGRHCEKVITYTNRYYNIYANPVFSDKEVAGAIIVVTDVTEKEERDNLRREFSANVSHELKTPLTSISGIAEIIKNGIVDEKDIPEFAGRIYDEAKRLINLVEDIIKVSQMDEVEDKIAKEEIDVYDVANNVIGSLYETADKNNITMELDGVHACVCGVPSVLDEMIFNLCDNAIKYNKDNGAVSVKVESFDDEKNDTYVKLSVKDTGIGIAKDQQERIFERFYRVDKSHSRDIGGTGLGLSIVKHGAKLHDAVISIESRLGEGTEITLVFRGL